MPLPLSLYSAAQVRELDRRAVEHHGIPGAELMARAGAAIVRAVRVRWPRAKRLAVVCGPGNNGGDGYVAARLARQAGLDPVVFTVGKRAPAGDAAAARAECLSAGVATQDITAARLAEADAVVDALFGSGLERAVDGEWRGAVDAINAAARPVVAADVPSGLNADTGAVMGAAVRADVTVCFIGLKAGLYTGAGREYAGEILFDDLEVPPAVYHDIAASAQRLTPAELRSLVRRRPRDSHKGAFGRVLVIGGGPGMAGAARLCGEAAYRTGAGLVTLATHPAHATGTGAACPELLVYGVRSAPALTPLRAAASAVAVGPGLSRTPWARAMYRAALATAAPLVVDADALNLLAGTRAKKKHWILTPHPGEAARLLRVTTEEVQRDRLAAARAIVDRYGGVCVLKGAGTLIATAAHTTVALCDRGNPGMASGGSGDVLSGVIAALCAQGMPAYDAARLGVWLHASAGDDAAAHGEIGLIASDLLPHLRRRLNELADHEDPDA
jgi:ADP-dependent NAD(P)H-hydrate dehydratase / NAD(P)H-hydrate epimerase